jgi:hypothetical protein
LQCLFKFSQSKSCENRKEEPGKFHSLTKRAATDTIITSLEARISSPDNADDTLIEVKDAFARAFTGNSLFREPEVSAEPIKEPESDKQTSESEFDFCEYIFKARFDLLNG